MILCYQAYGRLDVVHQTLFSIVSLLRFLPQESPLKIVVYTDMREKLEAFFSGESRVTLIEVTDADLKRWRGAIGFVHRVKLEVLRDCATRFSGPLFYADGDTYFLESPVALFQQVNDQTSLMHLAENVIEQGRDPLSKKIAKFLRKNIFQISSGKVQVPPSTVMWNAGVIGVSENNRKLFASMIELTDAMYSLYKKHVMEQLAVSYFLQRKTKVLASDQVIYHYWDQKPEYQKAIDDFLAAYPTAIAGVQNVSNFQAPAKSAPLPKKKRGFLAFLGLR